MTTGSSGRNGGSGGGGASSVLVTGAAGFIGSHVCDRLLGEGHRVWGLDNFDDFYEPSRKRANLTDALRKPSMHLVEGDVRDEILLDGLMADVPFDVVVHLAARPGAEASLENPDLCYDVNVRGTLRLLEAMRRHGVPALLLGSSADVYGEDSEGPSPETVAADRPASLYAASKRSAELLCHAHHHLYDLTVYALRLFTVYGPRQRPDLELHRLARRMLAGEPVPRYGKASGRRDYTYVGDVVDGTMLAIKGARERNGTRGAYEIVNLGRSESVGMDELVDALADALGVTPDREDLPGVPGDVPGSVASVERGKELLGYEPRVSLEEGLAEFAAWLREARKEQVPLATPAPGEASEG